MIVPVNNYRISQGYDVWRPNFYPASWQFRHKGIDIVGDRQIRAVSSGTVSLAKEWGGWGNVVVVQQGSEEWWYAHLNSIQVRPGQVVHPGDYIGIMGTTGNSTGVHLHLGYKVSNVWQDPSKFIGPLTTDIMLGKEKTIDWAHHLMLGRGPSKPEYDRWMIEIQSPNDVDHMMKDLARRTMDNGGDTYRTHILNAASFYTRGKDFSPKEQADLAVPTAFLGKVVTGMYKAKDRERIDQGKDPKIIGK